MDNDMAHDHETESGLVVDHEVEASEELAADEPHTPMWMPALGGVLFLCASIFFMATRPVGKTGEELSRASAAAAAEAAAKAAPPPMPEPAAAAAAAAPGGPGGEQPRAQGG